jgi:hypothetical protein
VVGGNVCAVEGVGVVATSGSLSHPAARTKRSTELIANRRIAPSICGGWK